MWRKIVPLAAALALSASAGAETIEKALQAKFPDVKVESVRPTPIEGLYEVTTGGIVLYSDAAGRYLLLGEMRDLQKDISLTELRMMEIRKEVLAAIPESKMIVDGPSNAQRTITVFSDVECPYCRKLDNELVSLMDKGLVQVRYALLPRAGAGTNIYKKNQNVWCSEEQVVALHKAMQGKLGHEDKECSVPFSDISAVASKLQVKAYPTLFLDNGMMLRGYVSAEEIEKSLRFVP